MTQVVWYTCFMFGRFLLRFSCKRPAFDVNHQLRYTYEGLSLTFNYSPLLLCTKALGLAVHAYLRVSTAPASLSAVIAASPCRYPLWPRRRLLRRQQLPCFTEDSCLVFQNSLSSDKFFPCPRLAFGYIYLSFVRVSVIQHMLFVA